MTAVLTGGINSNASEGTPIESFDGRTLYFYSTRPGGPGNRDPWSGTRPDRSSDFIFASARPAGRGAFDLWTATRGSIDDPFGDAENLDELNGPSSEIDPFLSEDGRELLFISDRRGRAEIWRATRTCTAL